MERSTQLTGAYVMTCEKLAELHAFLCKEGVTHSIAWTDRDGEVRTYSLIHPEQTYMEEF